MMYSLMIPMFIYTLLYSKLYGQFFFYQGAWNQRRYWIQWAIEMCLKKLFVLQWQDVLVQPAFSVCAWVFGPLCKTLVLVEINLRLQEMAIKVKTPFFHFQLEFIFSWILYSFVVLTIYLKKKYTNDI